MKTNVQYGGGQPYLNKKAFTLIELLAVIVILAIIALIATPIIINIINDSRENANKRSVELYGKAVEQAIAKAQLTEGEIPAGDLSNVTLSNNKKLLDTVQYSGNKVECTTNTLYEDGKIYLAGCKVGNDTKEYTYGVYQETNNNKPEQDLYAYSWNSGSNVDGPSIGDDASSLSTSAPSDKNYYLKFKLDDENKVTNAYVCAKFGGEEYCLEGGSEAYYGWDTDAAHSTGNVEELYKIQLANITGVTCSFSSEHSVCSDGSVALNAYSFGYVEYTAGSNVGYVSPVGSSGCISS